MSYDHRYVQLGLGTRLCMYVADNSIDADASRDPLLNIGSHFVSPNKLGTDRNKRAKRRESIRSNPSVYRLKMTMIAAMHLKQSLLLRRL